jgi:V8-like Glu-specific endopeptidase
LECGKLVIDARQKVYSPWKHPYWAIGELKSRLSVGSDIRGTATLISQKHILTVTHNIYNHKFSSMA